MHWTGSVFASVRSDFDLSKRRTISIAKSRTDEKKNLNRVYTTETWQFCDNVRNEFLSWGDNVPPEWANDFVARCANINTFNSNRTSKYRERLQARTNTKFWVTDVCIEIVFSHLLVWANCMCATTQCSYFQQMTNTFLLAGRPSY